MSETKATLAWQFSPNTSTEEFQIIKQKLARVGSGIPDGIWEEVTYMKSAEGFLVLAKPVDGGLFVSYTDETSTVLSIGGNIEHAGVDLFAPEAIFGCGQFCLGWEESRKVVRRVSDWKHQWTVPTDPDDGPWKIKELEKEWLAPQFNHDVLVCLHIGDTEAGRIEVWDVHSAIIKHIWMHEKVTWGVWAGDTLCTFSEMDGVVNTWQYGFDGHRSQFTMEGKSDLKCLGSRILQFSSNNRQGGDYDYRLVTGETVAYELYNRLANAGFFSLETFVDGTLIIQYKGGKYGNCKSLFEVINMDGGLIGSFEVEGYSIARSATFMNKFIVTCVDSNLSLWTREGTLVRSGQVKDSYPSIVDDGLGQICLFSNSEESWWASVLDMTPLEVTGS